MKTKIATVALSLILTAAGYAGTKVPIKDLPAPVSNVIAEYFPGATLVSAERDTDDGKTEYEVRIQYKKVRLEVDASPEGEILDVEMEGRAR